MEMWSSDDAQSESVASSSSSFAKSSLSRSTALFAGAIRQADDEDQEYGDDDFEGYSDEFESDDDDERGVSAWRVGDRVQGYWPEEQAWFAGAIAESRGDRYFIRYDDGEEQWEQCDSLRVAPPDEHQEAQQLQLLVREIPQDPSTLVHCRVAVFWCDEAAWFDGCIRDVSPFLDRIFVVYDDGDDQWIDRESFRDVLVHAVRMSDLEASESSSGSATVLVPRAYTPVVEHHFQPERVARPYVSVLQCHIGSIIRPRTMRAPVTISSLRVDLHLDSNLRANGDAQVQTEITTTTA